MHSLCARDRTRRIRAQSLQSESGTRSSLRAASQGLIGTRLLSYWMMLFFIFRCSRPVTLLLHFPASIFKAFERKSLTTSRNELAVWGEYSIWPEAALSYFFTGTPWFHAAVSVLYACSLGLLATISTDANHGSFNNC